MELSWRVAGPIKSLSENLAVGWTLLSVARFSDRLLGDKASDPHEVLLWRWRNELAVRVGDWKLVKSQTKRFAYKDWTLIDLSGDIEERQDLTAKHPEIAENLRERWERWERQNASHPPIGHDFKDDTEGQASFKR